jgi:hypothetical protein
MSDYFTKIVPSLLLVYDAKAKADAVVEMFIRKNIIRPVKTNCVLGNGLGYQPGIGIESIFDAGIAGNDISDFMQLAVNGLEVITERTVFDAGQAGLDAVECPVCNTNIIEGEWGNFLTEWVEHGNTTMPCDNCHQLSALNSYKFIAGTTQWGFSNLGFVFWNLPHLPISRDFLKEIELIVGSNILVIRGKL